MGESKDHALLSPSSAKRWLTCTPSARFEEQFPSTSSVFAEEGTLAHSIAEYILKKRLGIIKPADDTWLELVKLNSLWTPEMLVHCEQYADYCMTEVHADSLVNVETRIDLSDYVPESFGTGDFSSYTPSLKRLVFRDLKYGKGVRVYAEHNEQLMLYALGLYLWYLWCYGSDIEIEIISVGIYQPRINNNSEWEITVKDLLHWADTVLKEKAAMAFAGEGEYAVGDHCKFCKARVRCEALADHNLDLFRHALVTHDQLSDEAICDIIKKVPMLVSWAKDIEEYALSEAVTHGKHWEGMKVVEGRSNRIYVSEMDTEVKLLKAGFTTGEIYTTPELLGVTKLKAVLGAKTFKELVEPDLRKPPGKPTLVTEDDPRPAFDNAVAVFRNFEFQNEASEE